MSQERTRFPIQPNERRRSARSSDNVRVAPDQRPDRKQKPDRLQPDKPNYPPHERADEGD